MKKVSSVKLIVLALVWLLMPQALAQMKVHIVHHIIPVKTTFSREMEISDYGFR